GGLDGLPPAISVTFEQEPLELDPDLGMKAVALPPLHHVNEDVAGRQGHRLSETLDVRDDHTGRLLPAGVDVLRVEHGVAIGEPLPEQSPVVRGHVAVEAEREEGEAMRGSLRRVFPREVLASGEPEMIGPKEPDPVVVQRLSCVGCAVSVDADTFAHHDDYLLGRRRQVISSRSGRPGKSGTASLPAISTTGSTGRRRWTPTPGTSIRRHLSVSDAHHRRAVVTPRTSSPISTRQARRASSTLRVAISPTSPTPASIQRLSASSSPPV